jgi:hypothetical protein
MMTGLGVAVAVRHRSKTVRVVAPLAGYLTAAFLHMSFNTIVTQELVDPTVSDYLYMLVLLPLALVMAGLAVMWSRRQGGLIAQRLTDYVVMGWLPPTYPALFSRWWTRTKAILASPWHGNIVSTIRLQNAVTELAFLRDAITRGIADAGAAWREHELLGLISDLRARRAIENPRGLRPYVTRAGRAKVGLGLPLGRPAGAVASLPGGPVTQPVASGPTLQYSAVDPRWGPPV